MKFTIGQFLDAIDKNGYPWGKDQFFDGERYCIVGQALKNLGYSDKQLVTEQFFGVMSLIYNEAGISLSFPDNLGIMDYNDQKAHSYKEAAKYAHKLLDNHRNVTIELSIDPEG